MTNSASQTTFGSPRPNKQAFYNLQINSNKFILFLQSRIARVSFQDASKGFFVPSQDVVRAICKEVDNLVKKCGKPKMLDSIKLPLLEMIYPLFYSEVDVKLVFKSVMSKYLRKRIVEGGKRSDGRTSEEIRVIDSQCGLLLRAHGSALFTHGET